MEFWILKKANHIQSNELYGLQLTYGETEKGDHFSNKTVL